MAGTVPLALAQQIDSSGQPLAGALLYIFQAGTVATLQNSYQDFGLTILNPNPLEADQTGRIPMFWLADGLIHVRLVDSSGVVVLDETMQVLGPSSGGGGGGGGGGVDPTAVFSTGDFKFRPTTETLAGWVKANAQTIGSATSGATQRANADTLNLFSYLWNNYANSKCPVSGGRGANAATDFAANKTIGLPDWRSKGPAGLDDMGNAPAGIIQASNVTSGGGDGPTTPAAFGGEANHTLVLGEGPRGQFSMNDPGHLHQIQFNVVQYQAGANSIQILQGGGPDETPVTSSTTGITLTDNTGGGAHQTMSPFVLGTWFVKL